MYFTYMYVGKVKNYNQCEKNVLAIIISKILKLQVKKIIETSV